ncbi:MAG TPA: hypothetical protein VGR30_04295 [Candidatus Binatia bacterium]|jgi:hypothetical protein|nr:hypothetical protein [Candidatus Binatia bacterium]
MKTAIGNQRSEVSWGTKMRLVAALLVVFVGCSRAPSDDREARSAASAFYDIYMKIRPSGVPIKEQQDQLKPVLSSRLTALFYEASVAEGSNLKPVEGEASPKIEGDLFTSLDQGALSYKILQCESQKASATCIVELGNIDDRDNSKFTWKDRLFLVREGNRWVVDDIEYLGERQFMHKGHLKDLLSKVIEEAKKEAG